MNPVSRTVPVVFEFPTPDERFRVGLFVTARVYTGEEQEALAVPSGVTPFLWTVDYPKGPRVGSGGA